MKTKIRKVGDFVTPVDEMRDKENSTNIEHHFAKGSKLVIIRFSKVDSEDGTKNYWCQDEDKQRQMLNEKEITGYK